MSISGMNFTLEKLTLEDLLWLRDHQAKYAESYQATISATGNNTTFDKLAFRATISFKSWGGDTMTGLNELLTKFQPDNA